MKVAEHLRLMAVFGHLKGPGISLVWDEQKDGSLASDHKLDDSDAVLNIETRLQLELFLAGEVEGVLHARAEFGVAGFAAYQMLDRNGYRETLRPMLKAFAAGLRTEGAR